MLCVRVDSSSETKSAGIVLFLLKMILLLGITINMVTAKKKLFDKF